MTGASTPVTATETVGRHPVKTLVTTVDAPATTAQRWIDHLDRLGLVRRATDPLDRRRVEVSLTSAGETAIEAYLAAIAKS